MLNKDLTLSSDSDSETQVDAKANTEVARMGHSRPHTKSIKQKFKTPEYILSESSSESEGFDSRSAFADSESECESDSGSYSNEKKINKKEN